MQNKTKSLFSALLLTLLLAFTGCGGSSSGGENPPVDDSNDPAPDPVEVVVGVTADAGPDQNVLTPSSVTLDGGESQASDNRLEYYWEFKSTPGGSSAVLAGETSVAPRFTADLDGDYEVLLTVNSGQETKTDTVVIIASTGNIRPNADAGSDQNINKGTKVTLDGSDSSDANNDRLTYSWNLASKPNGSSASLTSTTSATPSFSADKDGIYDIELTVNDGSLDSSVDKVRITATTSNAKPIAKAGSDQNKNTGSKITLDGSKSTDANGDDITFRWTMTSKPGGSSATLSNPTAVKPTFTADKDGTYRMTLVVNDGTVNSSSDTINVTVSTSNSAPKANAGADKNIQVGTKVTLDGTKSSDADEDKLTYSWFITFKPTGSSADLTDWTSSKAGLTPDIAGDYIIKLTVKDSHGVSSTADSMKIKASKTNSAPVMEEIRFVDPYVYTKSDIYVGDDTDIEAIASDADNDPLKYTWTITKKPAASKLTTLTSQTSTSYTSFTADVGGDYIIKVVANDGTANSNAESLAIYVTDPYTNTPPIADAGPDVYNSDENVYLYADDSYDPDGDELTYRWRLVSSPVGTQELYDGADGDAGSTYIATSSKGDYVVELIVNDGTIDSDPYMITIMQTEDALLSSGLIK